MMLLVFIAITSLRLMVSGEKLSVDQKAPLFAQGAGGLRLEPPFEDPVPREPEMPVLGKNSEGEYAFAFQTPDGVQREEIGQLKRVGNELVRTVKGRYSYNSPEGIPVSVRYSADENGVRSSFTIGKNPEWKLQPLTQLPDRDRPGTSSGTIDSEKGYLPPTTQVNNGYLPPSSK